MSTFLQTAAVSVTSSLGRYMLKTCLRRKVTHAHLPRHRGGCLALMQEKPRDTRNGKSATSTRHVSNTRHVSSTRHISSTRRVNSTRHFSSSSSAKTRQDKKKTRSFTIQTSHYSTVNTDLVKGIRWYAEKLFQEKASLDSKSLSAQLTKEERERIFAIKPVAEVMLELHSLEKDIDELSLLHSEDSDVEMKKMISKEIESVQEQVNALHEQLEGLILPAELADDNDIILEVFAGVGGVEAGLFAAELFDMYQRFSSYKDWNLELSRLVYMDSSQNAFLQVQAMISGQNVYQLLKFESGVHRVQRKPVTEARGRLHTSTAVVTILPKPEKVQIHLKNSDLKWDIFKASGRGGQSVNTTESAVRVTHLPTGCVVESQQTRSQIKNKQIALEILKSRLYDKQLTEQEMKQSKQRKLQIGGANRNEKIRTYNFVQDRITDHRVKLTVNGIASFMQGDKNLEEFLHRISRESHRERLLEFLLSEGYKHSMNV